MPVYLRKPGSPLDACIDMMCLTSDYRPAHTLERILPDGGMTLVIRLDSDEVAAYSATGERSLENLPGALLAGPRSKFDVIDTACQRSVITVHFKPGGAYPFIGCDAADLRNLDAPAAELFGRRVLSLRHRLMHAASPAECFTLLETALLNWYQPARAAGPVLRFALRRLHALPAHTSVASVARETGLTERSLTALFRRHVGLLPKSFARVRRFHRVLKKLAAAPRPPEWADVAFDCGFFDQAHFIHDFRAFCGFAPEQYLQRRGEHLLHLPVA